MQILAGDWILFNSHASQVKASFVEQQNLSDNDK